ncbi:MAG: hypothetical protein JSV03_10480 [Planctomycetota bacterium]|nr:MAG: hypothetical protein JSV03_10480 [Planctomycetota bacterium]
MAKLSFRRYDTQARLSVVIALASVATMLILAFFVFRHINWPEFLIYYGKNRRPAIYMVTALTMLLAVIGFGLGYNSAGQRRNDKQQLSWLGFFISAGVMCLTLVLFFIFHLRGESIIR